MLGTMNWWRILALAAAISSLLWLVWAFAAMFFGYESCFLEPRPWLAAIEWIISAGSLALVILMFLNELNIRNS